MPLRYPRFFVVAFFALLASAWTSAGSVVAQPGLVTPDESKPKSVLVMDLKFGQGITKDNAFVLTQEIATVFALDSAVRVQTVEDTRVTLGIEAQKQMMGCDESSCLAEIAQAMGTDALLFGRLDRVGGQVTLQLTLLDSNTALPMVRVSAKDKDVSSILLRMDQILLGAKRALNPNYTTGKSSALFVGGLVGVGVGAATMMACGIVGTIAYVQMTDLQHDAPSREQTRGTFFWPSVVVGTIGVGVVALSAVVTMLGVSE